MERPSAAVRARLLRPAAAHQERRLLALHKQHQVRLDHLMLDPYGDSDIIDGNRCLIDQETYRIQVQYPR